MTGTFNPGDAAGTGRTSASSKRTSIAGTVSDARSVGAFYTGPHTAQYMARWLLSNGATRVLEPSFGDGVFLQAIRSTAREPVELFGAELVSETHEATVSTGIIKRNNARLGDFLAQEPFEVDGVIGNPPYVRLRHLSGDGAATALQAAHDVLGHKMQPSGSVWMPFVLHATRFLRRGGRMAFVLPFDFTYVKYARPLWTYLGANFTQLRLVRVRDRLFPDILQQVVLLFADGYGGATDDVTFEAYEDVPHLLTGAPTVGDTVQVSRLAAGERDFMRAHLDPELRALLARLQPRLSQVRSSCRFHIGYVCGHKGYFHPTPDQIEAYGLPAHSMHRSITSSRALTGRGIFTSNIDPARTDQLFLPPEDPSAQTPGEQRYIARGESEGVHQRYKCRARTPWYVVPRVKRPALILSVFAERPILTINDADLIATNSLLVGFLDSDIDATDFATAWYTSLTLLFCEIEVHALGGGLMVLIPGETGRIQTVKPEHTANETAYLEKLDRLIRTGAAEAAYEVGDAHVLHTHLGLTRHEIDLIRAGVQTLAGWRNSAR